MRQHSEISFHVVTSRSFWSGAPMVMSEILRRGHYLSCFDEATVPSYRDLLKCDVLIDMSAIKSVRYYSGLGRAYRAFQSSGAPAPLLVDPPEAIISSLDKRKTHRLFPELVPESYDLNGVANERKINRFATDEFVVVKPARGWWGRDVEMLTPLAAIEKHQSSNDAVVQKYVPATKGVGRIVTASYGDDFEILCSYLRVPKGWRTGVDIDYECVLEPVGPSLFAFAKAISQRCGLYLNGIDYIEHAGRYVLLEVNAVPAMREPFDQFGIDVPALLITHVERSVSAKRPAP